jgi:hypothetical protein
LACRRQVRKKSVKVVRKAEETHPFIGVAYCTAPWTSPQTFQNWSNIAAEVYNKTPSRLAYARDSPAVQAWGYFVDLSSKSFDLKEYFKLYLDPEYHDEYQDMDHQTAMRLYRDYLTCIHTHIARFFQNRFPQWATMGVEWNFSVPTTWKNAGMVNSLLAVIKEAGFGKDGPQHTCLVTLTEAEAAAVYGAAQRLQVHQIS